MSWLIQTVLGVVLKFVWGRVEEWVNQEIRYQENKRVLIEEVKDVARKAAQDNSAIAVTRESIDDSLLRVERIIQRHNNRDSGSVDNAD